MTTFPNSPRLVKGGIALIDPSSGTVERIIPLQYNPQSLSRSFQVQASETDQSNRSEALRLRGPAVETIKLEAEIDAADQLEKDDKNAVNHGIHPQLAALETMVHPPSSRLIENDRLAQSGTLEIVPMQSPLALFVWSKNRVVPVRLTELSITEEAFDPALNPIRAKVSLGLRVLSVDDLGFDHRGGSVFMAALQQKEQLAKKVPASTLAALGIGEIP
jgi:hypothetical protein